MLGFGCIICERREEEIRPTSERTKCVHVVDGKHPETLHVVISLSFYRWEPLRTIGSLYCDEFDLSKACFFLSNRCSGSSKQYIVYEYINDGSPDKLSIDKFLLYSIIGTYIALFELFKPDANHHHYTF